MISALPVSGAWQPKTIEAHCERPRISLRSDSFSWPWPLPPSSGPRWVAHRSWRRTSSLSGSRIFFSRASGGVKVRPGTDEVERLDLLADELVGPVELRLVVGIGLEVPRHWQTPFRSLARIAF